MTMLGVVGLLVAMYVGKKLLASAEPEPVNNIRVVPMALSDLKPGTLISDAHVADGKALTSKLTRDIVLTDRVLIGRVVKNQITAAQPISTFDLYPPGETPEPTVAPGMRLVTVPMGDSASLSMIRPGNYVDVHFTPANVEGLGRTGGGMTMTMFKGVRVQAINGNSVAAPAGRGAGNVTLELTKEQANIILLAKERGDLSLVYNPDGKDHGVVTLEDEGRATLYEILGITEETPPEQADPPHVTEIYSGAGRRLQEFREERRADLYAIENYDYYRNGRTDLGRNDFSRYGRQVPYPDFELRGGGNASGLGSTRSSGAETP